LDADRLYLIEGKPGTGKTTLALQFLLEGVRRGERWVHGDKELLEKLGGTVIEG